MSDMDNAPRILESGGTEKDVQWFHCLRGLIFALIRDKSTRFKRYLSLPDYIIDRWERAKYMGFGEGSSVYDSCLVLGDVTVGRDTWIGPFTILDGSGGGLSIGEGCDISAGVHIYTHDTVKKVLFDEPVSMAPVKIGNHVYIGPHSIIAKGVTIGNNVIIGANSFVNKDISSGLKAFGTPARVVGPSGGGVSMIS